jgi:Flp pilus assembly protein TadG
MPRVRKAAFILPISVLSLAMGCQNSSEKISKTFLQHPTIRIGTDANNPITSCFANIGWVTVASNGTVDWAAGAGDTNTYQVAFPTNPYPLIDSVGNPVTTPIVVDKSGTQSGTNKGPFAIGPSGVDACKAGADAAQCYFSYDIKYNGTSCIKHYGSGFGIYSTGIHIER